MNENLAAQAIEKVLRALIHCHKQNIVHRDLKPENIMYDKVGEVKLIDFGLAKLTVGNQKLTTIAGTPYFIAPEVLNGSYQKECDIWSLGVLLFVCVTGTFPFDSATKNRAEVFSKIQKCQYQFPPSIEAKLSPECKDLIRKMIVANPSKRISGEQALKHPWFEKCIKRREGTTDLIEEGVLKRLRQFKGSSTLKKAALNVLVKMLSPTDIENLRQLFQKLDTDNSGNIELNELQKALSDNNHQIGATELRHIVEELDYNGN
jgi:calcium-dependent protein kinase